MSEIKNIFCIHCLDMKYTVKMVGNAFKINSKQGEESPNKSHYCVFMKKMSVL